MVYTEMKGTTKKKYNIFLAKMLVFQVYDEYSCISLQFILSMQKFSLRG